MKDLSYCDSIERILISEKIDCDAIVISDELLQFTLLYRSEIKKTFTDNMIKAGLSCALRCGLIHMIPSKYFTIKSGLNRINMSIIAYEFIMNQKKYNEEIKKINNLHLSSYIKFYSTNSNSFIYLNKRLIDTNFSDILQISINPNKFEGVYNSIDSDHILTIFTDQLTGNYKFANQMSPA